MSSSKEDIKMNLNQIIGSPGTFETGMDITIFESKLTNFFLANSIANAIQKRAILLSSVSEEIHKVLFSLCVPSTPNDVEYDTLMKSLNNYFKPVDSYFAARHTFYQAKKRQDESVCQWGARVKNLASKCGFTSELAILVRDIFVVGMGSGPIQDRLLEEDASKVGLTYSKLMEIATTKEAAMNNKSDWKREGHSELNYHSKTRGPGQSKPNYNAHKESTAKCGVCGRSNHSQKDCRYKDYECNNCGKKGHLSTVCKKGKNVKKNHKTQNKFLANNDEDDETVNYNLSNTFFSIIDQSFQNRAVKPFTVDLIVENNNINFEIDTGSQHSVISKKVYSQLFSHITLKKNDISLTDYVGNEIEPMGKIIVNAEHKNKKFSMCIYVIDKGGPPLIGRNDIRKTNGCNLFSIENDKSIDSIISKYENVFKDEIGTFNKYEISLNVTTEAVPKFCKPRSIPLALKNKVETEIDRLVKSNILVPVDHSEWATPIVPILKSDGTVRICGDFKITLNPVLVGTEYPLPRIEHLYANISGSKYFSKIDLKDAYQQMVIKESDRKYTTINTHKGLFSYTRNPFGIKSSAGEFQKAMEISTAGLNGIGIFQDDIIVAGSTITEHNARLSKLLEVLSDCGLRVKFNKCKFLQKSIEYLGHRVDENGLHTLTKHTDAIKKANVPENKTLLKSFLGMVTYYIKFIPNAADILKPLYMLLRDGSKWHWTPKCDQAFNKIKHILTSKPVLAHYDAKLPIKLVVDSSSYALGAVLSHVYPDRTERPVAYASRVLSGSECKFPQIEKEALAIIFGVTKFYDYLFARKFQLETDHKPLIYIFGDKKGIPIYAANRLQRWAYVLSSFDFEIKYVKSENNIADFLSRIKISKSIIENQNEECISLNFIHEQSPFTLDWSKIKIETSRDTVLAKLLNAVKTGEWSSDFANNLELKSYNSRKTQISLEQGCLLWGYRVIIPAKFRNNILKELHSCHMGASSMKSLARSYFWWPGMDKEIENITHNCENCLNVRQNPPKSVISPWKWPEKPWTRVHCDFLGPFQNKYFFVIVDATTKWLEVFPVNSMTAEIVINKFSETIARFGIPKTITSDGAKCFTGFKFQSYCNSLGIRHMTGAPFHPESNGCAESAVKTIKNFFKKCSTSKPHLNKFLLMYRNTPHSTTRETPAQLMLGRSTRLPFDALMPNTSEVVIKRQISQINNGGNRIISFKIGENVLAKDYRNNNAKWQKGKITKCIGNNMYEVELKDGMVWERHKDQLLTDKSTTPLSNSISLTPARDTNENLEHHKTETDPNPDPVSVMKTPRPIRSRKPPQRYSPSDYD